jgi:uncharacterized protein involved in copper resistance
MIPSRTGQCQRAVRRAGRTVPSVLAASISALILTAAGATLAFAVPGVYPAEGPSAGATATPDPHASTAGMDPDMPGMSHDEMPGMDPDMPGMTHDEMPGMDPDMPGMTGSTGGHAHTATPGVDSRPQAAVVGTFAAVNGGVLLIAGLMRRRNKLTAPRRSRASRPTK